MKLIDIYRDCGYTPKKLRTIMAEHDISIKSISEHCRVSYCTASSWRCADNQARKKKVSGMPYYQWLNFLEMEVGGGD